LTVDRQGGDFGELVIIGADEKLEDGRVDERVVNERLSLDFSDLANVQVLTVVEGKLHEAKLTLTKTPTRLRATPLRVVTATVPSSAVTAALTSAISLSSLSSSETIPGLNSASSDSSDSAVMSPVS
jgi:hypothetical protein